MQQWYHNAISIRLYFFFFSCIQRHYSNYDALYYCTPLETNTRDRQTNRETTEQHIIFILQPIIYLASFSPPTPQAANRSICKALSLPLYKFVNVVDDVVLIPSALPPPHTIHLLIVMIPSFKQEILSKYYSSPINTDTSTNPCISISTNFNESNFGHFQKQQTIQTDRQSYHVLSTNLINISITMKYKCVPSRTVTNWNMGELHITALGISEAASPIFHRFL